MSGKIIATIFLLLSVLAFSWLYSPEIKAIGKKASPELVPVELYKKELPR